MRVHVTSKVILFITYLLEDEQELSLGMLDTSATAGLFFASFFWSQKKEGVPGRLPFPVQSSFFNRYPILYTAVSYTHLEALSRKLLALLGLNEEGVELTAVPLPALWPRLHAALSLIHISPLRASRPSAAPMRRAASGSNAAAAAHADGKQTPPADS